MAAIVVASNILVQLLLLDGLLTWGKTVLVIVDAYAMRYQICQIKP